MIMILLRGTRQLEASKLLLILFRVLLVIHLV